MRDSFAIRIEEDGTITCESGEFGSKETHDAADDFVKRLSEIAGGETEVRKKEKHGHVHHHSHTHGHVHQ